MSQEEDAEAFLEHYGVKGMHWGVRKSSRPSGHDIREARHRLRNQAHDIRETKRAGNKEEAKRMTQEFLANPDRITAAHMTRGEQVATLILSGGIPGAAGLAGAEIGKQLVKASVNKNARKLDQASS